ncbi:MAG TPA: type II secretion system F family protein [Microbacterium sp.]|nr:type II secretion system F family protein [Microbacterium sp.]
MAREVKACTIADTVLKLAVLLQAGVAPARAWAYLAHAGDDDAARVAAAVERGLPLPAAVADAGRPDAPSRRGRAAAAAADATRSQWRDVSAAWQVASAVGAPLADSLRALAVALRDGQEAADDVRVALAEPAATAKLMGWLPLVAVVLGVALGFDTFGTLLGNPIGIACLALGVALIIGAQRWNASLVRRARSGSGIPGLDAELLAIGLAGGVSIDRARALVRDATGAQTDAATEAVLNLSRTAGVPAVELLRASSALARHRARVDGRLRAARLSTRLLLPLGVCTLPAFLLLGVAPMLLSVMTSVPLPL